jgi:hypothetical protein
VTGRLALLLVVALAGAAAAHERSVSYSTWRVGADGRVDVALRVTQRDLSRIPPGTGPADGDVAGWLAGQLTLTAGGAPCTRGPVRDAGTVEGRVTLTWTLTCPPGPLVLESRLLADVAPSHLHFARLLRPGARSAEGVLSLDQPRWAVPAAGDAATADAAERPSLGRFVHLGVEHILGGWDHLAFVAALLLGAASLRDVARVVTGFTVGHSLTLGLATLGAVRADGPAVEALIGASIALVALESLWAVAARHPWMPRLAALALVAMAALRALGHGAVPAGALLGLALFVPCAFRVLASGGGGGMRWAVATLFGLVHGFGFAGVLAEAALAPADLARALFGFNVGVEAGQLAVVLLAWPLLVLAHRRAALDVAVHDGGNAALVALGTAVFLLRCYG